MSKLIAIALLASLCAGCAARREKKLPYDSVDCDNANGNPKLCTVESDEPVTVVVIIGYAAGGLHCDGNGCFGPDGYWTGTEKVYARGYPPGWSPDWKDAKQYRPGDSDPNFDVPNGMHCCYAECPTPIDAETGKVSWGETAEEQFKRQGQYKSQP